MKKGKGIRSRRRETFKWNESRQGWLFAGRVWLVVLCQLVPVKWLLQELCRQKIHAALICSQSSTTVVEVIVLYIRKLPVLFSVYNILSFFTRNCGKSSRSILCCGSCHIPEYISFAKESVWRLRVPPSSHVPTQPSTKIRQIFGPVKVSHVGLLLTVRLSFRKNRYRQ